MIEGCCKKIVGKLVGECVLKLMCAIKEQQRPLLGC